MISGGLIGGGQAPGVTAAAATPPAPPAPDLKAGTSSGTELILGEGAMKEIIADPTLKEPFKNYLENVAGSVSPWFKDLIGQGIQTVGSFVSTWLQWSYAESINDAKVKAAKHISDNQKEFGIRYIDFLEVQAPLHAETLLEAKRIEGNTAIEIRQRELDAGTQAVALGEADGRFFDPRSDYPGGMPQIPL